MKTDDDIKPVIVFSGTIWQAEMVKNLLENAEIEAFLKDEIIGTRVPWGITTGGVKVVVSSEDVDKAKLVVEEYQKNQENN